MILAEQELKDITGYARHADQRRWLTSRGWKFEVSATGRPIVSRSHADSMLSGEKQDTAREWKPNFAAFTKHAA